MANDRIIQYRTGISRCRNDDPPEEKRTGTGSKYSIWNLLLPWSYRTSNLWCESKTWISIYLWDDRISHCSDRLCCHINNSECDRCRRNSRNLIHSAKIYGKFCNLYVDRNRYPNRINTDRRKEKVIQRRKERKNDRRNRRNYRKKQRQKKKKLHTLLHF